MQALLLMGGTCTQLTQSRDGMSGHIFAKTYAGGLYPHWSKDCTQTAKGLKPGIYTNRICGKGEVAVSAIILDALSLDSLPSSVFFSKQNNTQNCNLQVVGFNKNVKVKFFSIPFFSLVKMTSNTMEKKRRIKCLHCLSL